MLYSMYQAQADSIDPFRAVARTSAALMRIVTPSAPHGILLRHLNAALEVFGHSGTTHQRPEYGVDEVSSGNESVAVNEEIVFTTAFANLLHFKKDTRQREPKVLVVAPMSGHFATLLRHTVEVLLKDHDVYITDWKNTRDVPLSAGRFGFDEYVEHVIQFLEKLGPRAHVMGVTIRIKAAEVRATARNGSMESAWA